MNNINKIKSLYKKSFLKNGDTAASVFWPKGRQENRFETLLNPAIEINEDSLTLCDFGCGLGHMQKYLESKELNKFVYTGYDIVPEMVKGAIDSGRNVKLINYNAVIPEKFDCVVASGVFNLKHFDSSDQNQQYVLERISMLLSISKKYFACDFMRPDVDYVQIGAWHQPYDTLISHLSKYSLDIEIIMRSLPYEYTVRVYLDA
jgi:2-polyprenyl-3-methyl-5-hydroxy-6-metoxy-1,4-benzoquinol methylase